MSNSKFMFFHNKSSVIGLYIKLKMYICFMSRNLYTN